MLAGTTGFARLLSTRSVAYMMKVIVVMTWQFANAQDLDASAIRMQRSIVRENFALQCIASKTH